MTLYFRRVPGDRPARRGRPVHIPRGVDGLLRSARKIFLVLRCKAVATSETNERIRTTTEAIREFAEVLRWCPGAESPSAHMLLINRSFRHRPAARYQR